MRMRLILLVFGALALALWLGRQSVPDPGKTVASTVVPPVIGSADVEHGDRAAESPSESSSIAERSEPTPTVPVPQARFDPSAWPPLPEPGRNIVESVSAMRERAAAGDLGAGCWLGVELLRCRELQDDAATKALRETVAAASGRASTAKPSLEQLRQTDHKLALLQRCQGVEEDMIREAPDWLLSSALGGSFGALDRIEGKGPLPTSDFPDGARLRRFLAERDRLLLMAVQAGSPAALASLRTRAVPGESVFRTRVPGNSPLTQVERSVLALFMNELEAHMRDKRTDSNGVAYLQQLDALEPTGDIPGDVRVHVTRLAEKVFEEGWSDPERSLIALADDSNVDTSQACTRFTAPVPAEHTVRTWLRP